MKLSSSVSIFYTPVVFLLSCAPAQVAPFDRSLWFMAQKTCFRVIYVLFGVRTKKNIFRKNRENYSGKDRQNIQIGITSFLYKISRHFLRVR